MIEPGKKLQQRYRIERQIGQGGMGAVFIATDERFGSVVAIKQTLATGEKYQQAIGREARLLNSLKHQALPRVTDHFFEADGQFLVMEYIPGVDLAQMIEAAGVPFSVDQVLRWADQLLDALVFLHSQSTPVIHRDIKPQNLKLASRDQIILLDFGLAKGNPMDADGHTAAKSIFGYSRNYASLEQIEGTGTDPRSDLYSLAATLYHLVTGEPPEDALSRAMCIISGGEDPLEPAVTRRPDLPKRFNEILQAALSLNAKDRPASAAEMQSVLRGCEDHSHRRANFCSVVKKAVNTDVFAQDTRLMPACPRVLPGDGGSENQDLDHDVSLLRTPVSAGSSDSNRRPKKRVGIKIASAFAAMLVTASAGVGFYFYDPSQAGAKPVESAQIKSNVEEVRTSSEISNGRDASASERGVSNERSTQQVKSNSAAQPRSTGTPRTVRASTNNNTAISQDSPGSVYVGHNVWVGRHKLPNNTTLDGTSGRRRVSRKY